MIVGAGLGLLGIFIAYTLYVKHPERPKAIQARFRALHGFFAHKWYFDEAVSTSRSCARSRGSGGSPTPRSSAAWSTARSSAAPAARSRAASAAVRRVQTGYLRYYAALLLVGLTGLGAYFLISA